MDTKFVCYDQLMVLMLSLRSRSSHGQGHLKVIVILKSRSFWNKMECVLISIPKWVVNFCLNAYLSCLLINDCFLSSLRLCLQKGWSLVCLCLEFCCFTTLSLKGFKFSVSIFFIWGCFVLDCYLLIGDWLWYILLCDDMAWKLWDVRWLDLVLYMMHKFMILGLWHHRCCCHAISFNCLIWNCPVQSFTW